MTHSSHEQGADRPARGSHLDSWKEIAAYLNRDIRTVQRWEKQEGLPVHRHQHDERGTAYAYSAEIDEWVESRRRQENARPIETQSRRVGALYWGSAIAVGTVALLIWTFAGTREQPRQLSSLSIVFPPSEQFHEWGPDMTLSPDGSTLAYNVRSQGFQLHVRRLDQLESRAFPGTVPAIGPFFSPDGRWIGFFQNGVLKKVAVDGGTPVPLDEVRIGFQGTADWGTDDHIVYADVTPKGTHGLYRVPADGGERKLVAALDGQAEDTYWLTPQSLPGGTSVLCTVARTTPTGVRFQLEVVSVATGERRVLIDDAKHGRYLGDGTLVYLQGDSLFATRFDTGRFAIGGQPVPAWEGVGDRVRFRSWAYAAGTLVYWPNLRYQRRLAWVDRSGNMQPLALPPALFASPRISPDGKRIAFKVGGEFANIWTYNLADGSTAQLTFDGRSIALMWTPDGSRLTISTVRDEFVHVGADGATPPQALRLSLPTGLHKQPRSWLRGGRELMISVNGQPSLWAVPMDGGESRPIRSGALDYGSISADGRWIAYVSGTMGRRELYVAPFPTGHAQWKVSDAGDQPVWAKSGRELFYRSGQQLMSVPIAPGDTFKSGAPRVLFTGRYYEGEPGGPNYDVSLDDQRFLMVVPGNSDGPDRLNVVQGLGAEIANRLRAIR